VTEEVAITDTQETQPAGEGQPTGETFPKKQRKSKGKWVSAEEVAPKPSHWPLALTVAICVLLMGIMMHPIVIGVGAILVIGSIMGWILERR
jgi:hypothetical protein